VHARQQPQSERRRLDRFGLEQGFVSVEQVGDPRVRFVLSSFVAL
jgi:hypothetical protein